MEIQLIMKRLISSISLAICCFLFSCEKAPEEIPVSSVTLNQPTAEMIVGESVQLSATVLPSNASDKTLTWASSKQSVATVSSNGMVTALSEGSSTITVTAGDKSASCKVTVEKKVIPVTSISLSKTELSLIEGDEETLAATVKPDDATDKTVKWESSDRSIASVNNEGKVSAIKEGTASITASSGNQSASCKVTVAKRVIAVESVVFNKTEVELVEGESETLTATVKPDNATDKTVTWSSSDPGVVSVENGKITAIKAGNATITAKAGEKSGNCKVTVKQKPHVESLKIKDGSFSGLINKYYPISVTITPSDAQYDLEWIISDSRVAEVQGSGLSRNIYTKDFGKAEITVKDKISGKSAAITVRTSVMDFEWNENTGSTYGGYPLVTIEEGEEYQLHYSCSPSSATHLFEDLSNLVFYEPTYAIEKPSIISIDPEGKVTGLKVGTVGIKPTGQIIKKSSGVERVYIKVKARTIAVTEVRLDKSSLTLNIGESAALTATVLPENATDKTVTWKSSDATVVSVTNDGKVSAIKAGNATITALAGNQSTTCDITVVKPSSENIVFADQKVKEKLVAAFDQNKDGELSYEEAAAVTSIDGVFGAIKTYKSFDEFQYFTGVTSISANMFENWNMITSIRLPKSVEQVGKAAFRNCIYLASINIPDGVTNLMDNVFYGCTHLQTIEISNNLRTIGECVFWGCKDLSSINLPEGLTTIGDHAFRECESLVSIVIPESVKSIGGQVFGDCSKLKSVTMPQRMNSIGGWVFCGCTSLTTITIPRGITNIGGMFADCASLSKVIIPDEVTSINYTFSGCTNLSSISLPDGITSMAEAFHNCTNLLSITLPPNVTNIDGAFSDCIKLTSIEIPETITSLDGSFHNCFNLSSIRIPESVTSIRGAFENCSSLTSISIPNSVTNIESAFQGCSGLISVVVPESVTMMSFAFSNCTNLKNVNIPHGVNNIDYAFRNCSSLESIHIPESVTSMASAFTGCSKLLVVIVPDGMTTITQKTFEDCSSLKSVSLPESISFIGKQAFHNCQSLETISIHAPSPPSLGSDAFYKTYSLEAIYVPSNSVNAYKAASGWNEYDGYIKAIP